MNEQRWGGKTRQDNPDSGREIILNAARACYAKNGVAGTTIEDIGKEAKITRRSIYRYFENKNAIIQALVDEQAAEFLVQMSAQLGQFSTNFPEMLKHYMLYVVKHGPGSPGHQLFLGSKNLAATGQYYFSSKANYETFSKMLRPVFEEAKKNGQINPNLEYRDLMQWATRLVFSYIQLPTSEAIMEKQIEQFLFPSLKPV